MWRDHLALRRVRGGAIDNGPDDALQYHEAIHGRHVVVGVNYGYCR